MPKTSLNNRLQTYRKHLHTSIRLHAEAVQSNDLERIEAEQIWIDLWLGNIKAIKGSIRTASRNRRRREFPKEY
jgi:hypothetical protein